MSEHAYSAHDEYDDDQQQYEQQHRDPTQLHNRSRDASISIQQPRHFAPIECPSVDALTNPLKSGWLTKRGYRLGCIPVWKRRWCVIQGGFMFKFESPDSKEPAGLPIPLLGSTCTLGPLDPASTSAAEGHRSTMTLETFRKEYVLGAESEETMKAWIETISTARALAIKQQLGHAAQTQSDDYAARSGAYLTQRSLDRENEEVEESRQGRIYA